MKHLIIPILTIWMINLGCTQKTAEDLADIDSIGATSTTAQNESIAFATDTLALTENSVPVRVTITKAEGVGAIEVALTSSSPDLIEVPASIVLDQDEQTKDVVFTPKDNSNLEGNREVQVVASVEGYPDSTITISLTDDEISDFAPVKAKIFPPDRVGINQATIGDDFPIMLIFNRQMNPGSLIVSGSLAAGAKSEWITTDHDNDTLILKPQTAWEVGASKTIIINASDVFGIPAPQTSLEYTVSNQIAYVQVGHPGTQDGSKANPKVTIEDGLAMGYDVTYVSEGTYFHTGASYTISAGENQAFYGGFSEDWTSRHPQINKTVIDSRTNVTSNIVFNYQSTGSVIHLDGFDILPTAAHASNVSIGISTQGSTFLGSNLFIHFESETFQGVAVRTNPVSSANIQFSTLEIRGNNSYGMTCFGPNPGAPCACSISDSTVRFVGTTDTQATGVYPNFFTMDFKAERNTFESGASDNFTGIHLYLAGSAKVINNVVVFSELASGGVGIFEEAGNLIDVFNNTIIDLSVNGSFKGIVFEESATNDFQNNIILTTGDSDVCLEYNGSTDLNVLEPILSSNVLFGCDVQMTDVRSGCVSDNDGDGDSSTCNVTDISALLTDGAGNLDIDPMLKDSQLGYYFLSSKSPSAVRSSAADLSGDFTIDFNRSERTGPTWSFGAFQK